MVVVGLLLLVLLLRRWFLVVVAVALAPQGTTDLTKQEALAASPCLRSRFAAFSPVLSTRNAKCRAGSSPDGHTT